MLAAGLAAGLAVVTLFSCFACKGERERKLAAEAQRMVQKINQLRDSPNNQRTQPLRELSAEACSQPPVCELKQVCLQAYTLHEKSLEAAQRVREALREGTANRAGAAELLRVSEADIERARKLTHHCVELQGELEREAR